ncbi:MAG: hypothetical protein EOP82_31000 [Variovorax sp.]|nr:MAG: hypothetical protein EOP82_31000 [Variovorax sp.]
MKTPIRSSLAFVLAAASLMGASSALAAGATSIGADASILQRERAVCDGIQQDRAACLREAGAARQAARQGDLTSAAPTSYEQNALARCNLQPPTERVACEARMRGTGMTSVEGSVLGGGLIRETVTPITPGSVQ